MKNELIQSEKEVVPGFFSSAAINQLKIITSIFSKSKLVPETYRNNDADCAIVLSMAARMNVDPLMMLQNVYVVYGTPTLSSKMMIALFNSCGRYSSIYYKETGTKGTDSQGVIAWAKELATGEVLEGPEVTVGVAKKEGWYAKKGSKWLSMPNQMLRYRAAAWLIRTTAPELSMGLQTADELEDVGEPPKNITEQVAQEIEQNANTQLFEPKEIAQEETEKVSSAATSSITPAQEIIEQSAIEEGLAF